MGRLTIRPRLGREMGGTHGWARRGFRFAGIEW